MYHTNLLCGGGAIGAPFPPPTTTLAVTNGYVDAVSAKDLAAVADMFADDIAGVTWQIS